MSDTTVAFNPFEPGYIEHPYAQFAALRAHDPVHRTPFESVFVSRYDDVFTLLRDNTLSADSDNAARGMLDQLADDALAELPAETRARIAGVQSRQLSMLDRDPPDHSRLRKLVSRAFTPRRIGEMRPLIERIVHERLDRASADGGFEAVGGLAFPLPFDVISEMLGMPDTDAVRVRDLSSTLVRSLEPVTDPDLVRRISLAGLEMTELLDEVIAWKRANPGDDLLTLLIDAEEDGDRLTDAELTSQVSLLFIAGHETTVNLIGNGLLALARHPEQRARLVEDPDLVTNAVDELLRYDAPVQMTRRIPLEPRDLHGVTLEPGSFVLCSLASANRDEDHFGPDAAELDLGRADAHDHLAFGGGVHYCLGASLAKLEAAVAIGALVERFPHYEVVGEPVYNGRINLRGLDELTLRFPTAA